MGLLEAVQSGDRVKALTELRDTLAREIEACDSARDVAALSRQLTDVLAMLAKAAPPESKGTPLDELASRRARGTAS